jgi:hypothetical protein
VRKKGQAIRTGRFFRPAIGDGKELLFFWRETTGIFRGVNNNMPKSFFYTYFVVDVP